MARPPRNKWSRLWQLNPSIKVQQLFHFQAAEFYVVKPLYLSRWFLVNLASEGSEWRTFFSLRCTLVHIDQWKKGHWYSGLFYCNYNLKIHTFEVVKRLIAITFLSLYILTATECSQLLKIPKLVSHFTEHQDLDRNLSFFEFLYMHYTDHDINDNDQDKDMQLPFKTHGDCAFSLLKFSDCPPYHCTFNTFRIIENIAIPSTDSDFESTYLSNIWQPPKSC